MDPNPPAGRTGALVLASVMLLALAVRLPLLGWGLPDVLEEAIPFWIAWGMWGWHSAWRLGADPGFFRYPSLVIYLQLAAQVLHYVALRLTGSVHSVQEFYAVFQAAPGASLVIARSITTAFGVLTLWPAWALARRAAGMRAALLTVLLLALHPVLLARSQLVEVDLPLTFFITWGLLLAVCFVERPSVRRALGMGLVAGLATSCKYPGVLLLAPAMVAIAIARRVGPAAAPATKRLRTSRRARSVVARGPARWVESRPAWALLSGGALLTAFLATSPYVLIDRAAFVRDLLDERQHMAMGHFGLSGAPAFFGYAREWFAGLMGWPLGIAALAGVAWFAARRRPWALVLAGFLVPYVIIVGSWRTQAERYLVPLVPLGVVAAAAWADAAIDAAAAWLSRRRAAAEGAAAPGGPARFARGRLRARLATVAGVTLAALALGGPLAPGLSAVYASRKPDTRTRAREWIEANVPAGSLVLSEAYGPDLFSTMRYRRLKWSPPAVRATLKRLHYERPLYAVLELPIFQVSPERSARFYSVHACSLADIVIVSSSVRDRYRSAPARFGPQLTFYDSLEASWRKLQVFRPGRGPGPELVIYANPRGLPPFGVRRDLGPAEPFAVAGPLTGAEGAHYAQLGLNYEVFGHPEQAKQCYLRALKYGRDDPANYVSAATWLSQLLWREQDRDAAIRVIASAEQGAVDPGEAGQLAALRESLEAVAAGRPARP